MPELPDVEVFRRTVESAGLNRKVETVHLPDGAELLVDTTPRTIRRHLMGHKLTDTHRHGKHLFLRIGSSEGWLRLHFGMTGFVTVSDSRQLVDYPKLRLDFEGGSSLVYTSRRKLEAIGLVQDLDRFKEEEELGTDALDESFSRQRFAACIRKHRSAIKSALMNQSIIAGLGNVYSDEILFQAGVHPRVRADKLDPDRVARAYDQMHRVLDVAIDAEADPGRIPDGFLLGHRSAGETCPLCGGKISKIEVSGRPGYYCPSHQELG